MKRYSQANNAPKTAEMGRKELALDPQSLPALLTVASVVSQTAHTTDLDFKDRYQEVLKDANQAIQLLSNPATAPQGLSPDQVNSLKSLPYAAIGNIEFVQAGDEGSNPAEKAQHDAAAEQALRQSTSLNTTNPDPGEWLRLAVTLDHQKKYPEALEAANKAVQYSASEPNVLTLAQQEQTRLKALAGPNATGAAPIPH
jgi:tetratricopeptide (TPR) repeat protein